MSLQEIHQPGPEEAKQRAAAVARRLRLGIARPAPTRPVRRPPKQTEPTHEVVAAQGVVANGPITLRKIIGLVSAEFGISADEIKGKRRTASLIGPRRAIAYLAQNHTSLSLLRLGQMLGGRDHTSIIWHRRHGAAAMREDPQFALVVADIERRLLAAASSTIKADLIVVDGKVCADVECPHCHHIAIETKRGE